MKRNNELERTVSVLLDITDDYSDDLKKAKKQIKTMKKQIITLEQMVQSLQEDNTSILKEVELKPKRTRKTKKKGDE